MTEYNDPSGAGGPEDWRLEMDAGGVRQVSENRPGLLSLLVEILGFADTEDPCITHPFVNVGIYLADLRELRRRPYPVRWLRRTTRLLSQAVRRVFAAFVFRSWSPRLIRVVGVVGWKRGSKIVEFSLDVNAAYERDDDPDDSRHVLVMATHPPTLSEVSIAFDRARRRPTTIEDSCDWHEDGGANPPTVIDLATGSWTAESALDRFREHFSDLDGHARDVVVATQDSATARHLTRKVLIDTLRSWVKNHTGEIERLLASLEVQKPLGWKNRILFWWRRRQLHREVSRSGGRVSDDLRERVALFLWNHRCEADSLVLPPWFRGTRLHPVATEHLAYLLLAHFVINGNAARLFHSWLHESDRTVIFEWRGLPCMFDQCAAAVSRHGALLGIRRSSEPAKTILGPWEYRKGRPVETQVRAGDLLYVAKWGEHGQENGCALS